MRPVRYSVSIREFCFDETTKIWIPDNVSLPFRNDGVEALYEELVSMLFYAS